MARPGSAGQKHSLFVQSKLGRRIRELRRRKKWSQDTLASRCGLHLSHVGKIERGGANTTLATLLAIARNLQITISDLFKGISS